MAEQKIVWPPASQFSSVQIHPTFRAWLALEMASAIERTEEEIKNLAFYNGLLELTFKEAKYNITADFIDLMDAWSSCTRCDSSKLMNLVSQFKTLRPGSEAWFKGIFAMRRLDGTITSERPVSEENV